MIYRRFIYCLLMVACSFCGDSHEELFYEGRLEELVMGQLSIDRDSVTEYFSSFRTWTYKGEEFLIYQTERVWRRRHPF